MLILSIASDIKFGVLDILRGIGIFIVNTIYSTIDVLYDVAHKINSLNFIEMLENIENSSFTKIFNAFIILAFAVLFLFAVWKITFKILDADENQENSLAFIVKEIIKCGFLIFCIYLLFSTTINLGINLSNAIYNSFNTSNSTIGDKMKSAYLTVNESCHRVNNTDSSIKVDNKNVEDLKSYLDSYADLSSVTTVEDFEKLIRSDKLTATNIIDSGAFSYTCEIYKKGIWNNSADYTFSYNFLFGIVIGAIFLFAIGFAVLMLGRRQLELAFLMVISPLVFATSVCRKEQRSALYQQLASLILQAGAMMLLIGLTSIMFGVIQNSSELNNLPYFTKIVAQSILYIGCAMMLMTGCTSLNRFIGENVSSNSGRDMMMAMRGMAGGLAGAVGLGVGAMKIGKGATKMTGGLATGVLSTNPKMNSGLNSYMNWKNNLGKNMQNYGNKVASNNSGLGNAYGKLLAKKGEQIQRNVGSNWDLENQKYNWGHVKSGFDDIRSGLSSVKGGLNGNLGYGGYGKFRNNNKSNFYDYDNTKNNNSKI